jgi:hypothetical protein
MRKEFYKIKLQNTFCFIWPVSGENGFFGSKKVKDSLYKAKNDENNWKVRLESKDLTILNPIQINLHDNKNKKKHNNQLSPLYSREYLCITKFASMQLVDTSCLYPSIYLICLSCSLKEPISRDFIDDFFIKQYPPLPPFSANFKILSVSCSQRYSYLLVGSALCCTTQSRNFTIFRMKNYIF